MHALSKVPDIPAVQASHGDPSIGCHVYVCLLRKSFRLRRGKTCETVSNVSLQRHLQKYNGLINDDRPEHADLGFDVSPLSRSLELIGERIVKLLAHVDNTVCHSLNFLLPARITMSSGEK